MPDKDDQLQFIDLSDWSDLLQRHFWHYCKRVKLHVCLAAELPGVCALFTAFHQPPLAELPAPFLISCIRWNSGSHTGTITPNDHGNERILKLSVTPPR